MLWFKKLESDELLESEITEVLHEMGKEGVNSGEYSRLLAQLERLQALKEKNRRPRVSGDAIVTAVGGLLGILVIVSYEHTHVITTKAINMIRMGRST